MARPKYQVNKKDWLDILDWLDYQIQRPDWITLQDHPIHHVGIHVLQECVSQWRLVKYPSAELCSSVQETLQQAFDDGDWARLRKALSAKKRRRKEVRNATKPTNITLTKSAHLALAEFKMLSGAQTLSEALELGLAQANADLKANFEKKLFQEISSRLLTLASADVLNSIERYLSLTTERRSLANTCKIAWQYYSNKPGQHAYKLLVERFVEDLVWNEVHLKVSHSTLALF